MRRRGGRRSTDVPAAAAVALPGAALPDRVAYLEGSLAAAWEILDGHFQRLRDTQAEMAAIKGRLRQLADVLQVLTAATNTDRQDIEPGTK